MTIKTNIKKLATKELQDNISKAIAAVRKAKSELHIKVYSEVISACQKELFSRGVLFIVNI